MRNRILLISCACLVVIGLAVSLVGLALGGGYGSFEVYNGQVTYHDGNHQYTVGWLPGRWRSSDSDRSAPAVSDQAGVRSAGGQDGSFVEATQLKKLSFNISAGYLTVVAGKEASLTADGAMDYHTNFINGEWQIYDNYSNIVTRNNRFYIDGKDITTYFTLTLPQDIYEMNITLDIGTLTVQAGFTPYKSELKTDLGIMNVHDLTATELSLTTELGTITAEGIKTDVCRLAVALGSIEFEGETDRRLEANCDLGSIVVRMPRPSHYGWEANGELANISIDGQFCRGSSGHEADSISPYFQLKCELGNISIIFT